MTPVDQDGTGTSADSAAATGAAPGACRGAVPEASRGTVPGVSSGAASKAPSEENSKETSKRAPARASAAASSASRSRRTVSRRGVRLAVAATGLAGALVLTGCGGDGGSGGDPTPSGTASAPADGGTGGTGGADGTDAPAASSAPAGELEGSWLATADGKAVALMVTGEQAALFVTGGTVCSGTTREDAGTPTISLRCTGGDGGRTSGTVDSVSGSTLRITWEGSPGTETYTKAEGGRLPSGLPTTGPGS